MVGIGGGIRAADGWRGLEAFTRARGRCNRLTDGNEKAKKSGIRVGVGNMKGREEKPHAATGSSYSAELTAGWEDAVSALEFFSPLCFLFDRRWVSKTVISPRL